MEAGSESAQAPGNVAPEDEDPQDAEGVPEDSLEHRQERLHDVVCPTRPSHNAWKAVQEILLLRLSLLDPSHLLLLLKSVGGGGLRQS